MNILLVKNHKTMNLENKIEGYLFIKGEAVSYKEICKFLKCTQDELQTAISHLKEKLQNSGISLIDNGEELSLATSAEFSSMAEELRTEELSKELTKATLEVLSIVLYKGSCTRAEIDYIRGVNSSYVLRNLEMRGLVSKKIKDGYERIYEYFPTIDTLAYLNIDSIKDLPNYDGIYSNISKTLAEFQMLQKLDTDGTD